MYRVIGVTSSNNLRLFNLDRQEVIEVTDAEAKGLDILPTYESNILTSRRDKEYYVLYALRDDYILIDKKGQLINVKANKCMQIADKLINMQIKDGKLTFFDTTREKECYFDIENDMIKDCYADIETLVVPSYIRRICKKAFKGSSVKYLKLPHVEVVEPKAFINSQLSVIDFGNSLKTIGYEAFRGCANLNFVRGLQNLTKVENKAFANCLNLQYFPFRQIRSEEITIGEEAFMKTGILTVDFTDRSAEVNIDARAFKNCDLITGVEIAGHSDIGDYAFCGCRALKNLTIANAKTIGQDAFADTVSLSNVEVNSANIHSTAFEGSLYEGAEG